MYVKRVSCVDNGTSFLVTGHQAYVMSRRDLRVISRSFSIEALRDLKSDILLESSAILSESHSSFKDLLHLGADGPQNATSSW